MIIEVISVQSSISDAGSYYFYAAIAFCAAILGLTVLPETKVKCTNKKYFYFRGLFVRVKTWPKSHNTFMFAALLDPKKRTHLTLKKKC